MATINMHMKFEIEIPKQTWLMLWKPCRLQTDGQGESSIPPSNFVGRGYNYAYMCHLASLGYGYFLDKWQDIESSL